jgi:hypothetical protein
MRNPAQRSEADRRMYGLTDMHVGVTIKATIHALRKAPEFQDWEEG